MTLENSPSKVAAADPVGGLSMGPTMIKGFAIAVLALLGATQVDQYLTNGRYTDGAMAMVRQISHSFGV